MDSNVLKGLNTHNCSQTQRLQTPSACLHSKKLFVLSLFLPHALSHSHHCADSTVFLVQQLSSN